MAFVFDAVAIQSACEVQEHNKKARDHTWIKYDQKQKRGKEM